MRVPRTAGDDGTTKAKLYLFTHIHFDVSYNKNRIVEINVSTDPSQVVDVSGARRVERERVERALAPPHDDGSWPSRREGERTQLRCAARTQQQQEDNKNMRPAACAQTTSRVR